MAALEKENVTHYLELGPHPVMLGMGQQCLREPQLCWLPSVRRGRDDWETILSSLSRLYVDGIGVDWKGFDASYVRNRVWIPGYAFEPRRHWISELESFESTALIPERPTGRSARNAGSAQCYQLHWELESRPVTKVPVPNSVWLLLSADAQITLEFADSLKQQGIDCIRVLLRLGGQGTNGPNAVDLTICHSLEDIALLIDREPRFQRVVYCADGSQVTLDGQHLQDHNTAQIHLLSRIVSQVKKWECARLLWVITQNAVAIEPLTTQELNLHSAALWGFARGAALELSMGWGGIVDCDDWQCRREQIIFEIQAPNDDDQIGLRGSHRFVPRIRPLEVKPCLPSSNFVRELGLDQGAILITGGLGGIGTSIASWLVEFGARHLVLASRTGMPSSTATAAISKFRQSGVTVDIVAADVATVAGVDACMAALHGQPITAIFHAAGIDLVKPIGEQSLLDIDNVCSAKVKGAWLLHQKSDPRSLKLFVCCSSIAAIWGSVGRSAYAAANSFLDSFVHWRRSGGLPALSINFGPWHGVGMADETSLAELERIGNFGLDPCQTLRILADLIQANVDQATIAHVDWSLFRTIIESRRPRPILGDLGKIAVNSNLANTKPPQQSAWAKQILACPSTNRSAKLTALLRDELARILREPKPERISADRNLFELGLDSLTYAEFSSTLHAKTGATVSMRLSAAPTIEGISKALLAQLESNPGIAGPADAANSAVANDNDWATNLASEKEARRVQLLVELVTTELSRTLARSELSTVSPSRPLTDLGLDSLAAVELANRIQARMGLKQAPRVLSFRDVNSLAQYLSEGLPAPRPSEIIGYTQEIEPSLFEFLEQAFPERRRDWIVPRWEWMFLGSARRLGVEPQVWLFRDGEKIVGHHGAQFIRFKIGDQQRTTAWLVETMVHDSHRSLGVGTRLVIQSKDDLPFSLSLGQTVYMRTILERLGWQCVAPLQTYLLPINPSRVLRDKLSAALLPVASAWFHLRGATRRIWHSRFRTQTSVRQIDSFGSQHDQLWNEVASGYRCATVRDAAYLNWKYVEQPGQTFMRLEISSNSRIIGIAILSIAEPDETYHYKRAFLVDLVTSSAQQSLDTVVSQVVHFCRQQRVDAVIMHVMNDAIQGALDSHGFLKREPTRHLLVSLDENIDQELVLNPSNWLITQGDSDIDRPW